MKRHVHVERSRSHHARKTSDWSGSEWFNSLANGSILSSYYRTLLYNKSWTQHFTTSTGPSVNSKKSKAGYFHLRFTFYFDHRPNKTKGGVTGADIKVWGRNKWCYSNLKTQFWGTTYSRICLNKWIVCKFSEINPKLSLSFFIRNTFLLS